MNDFQTSDQMMEPNRETIQEMLPSYVLGILDPDEMIAVDDYIRAYPELQQEVARLEITTAQLAYAAPEMPVPADAVARAVARVQEDLSLQQVNPVMTPALAPNMVPVRSPRAANLYDQPYVTLPLNNGWIDALGNWFRQYIGWKTPALGAAAAMLLLAWMGLQALNQVNLLETELDNAQLALQQVEQNRATLQSELAVTQEYIQQLELENSELLATIDSVLVNPSYTVSLAGENPAGGNLDGSFYANQEAGLLIVRGLQDLPVDQTYQLWLIPPDSQPIPSGLVSETDGGVTLWADVIPLLNEASITSVTIAISIEPAGGSPAPTGPVIASGTRA